MNTGNLEVERRSGQQQGLANHSLVLEFSEDDTDSSTDGTEDSLSDLESEQTDSDLAYYERTVREIVKGDAYTCMICTVEMDYTCKMFACSHCYRVFDYDCIREWAVKSTEKTVDRIWKCPNCYHTSTKVPQKNRPTCWCGKSVIPDPNPIDPNSCGQTCNAPTCAHGCSKICHLGPHPECMRTLSVKCKCGKHAKDIFCYKSKSINDKNGFQCDEECGLSLPCGIHKCKIKCHSGLCGACPAVLTKKDDNTNIRCYCGLHSYESLKCKDLRVASQLSTDIHGKSWIGAFACAEVRNVEYACRKHSFVEACQAPPTISGKLACRFSPKFLKTCPCGKTRLKSLAQPRKLCTDPIPRCESRCGRKLGCGKHTCPFTCHEGPCMDPCIQVDIINCSCHQKKFQVPCNFGQMPHCNTKCESLMSCRRHRCTERCCSGRPSAERRRKTPYSSRELLDESLVEAQHICLKECNLMLSCGKHKCHLKCHPGKCPPCLESSSNDLVCSCGKTFVEAPVRCGTVLPPCKYPCIKVVRGIYECRHKPMPHECHPLDQKCPPCTAPVSKACKCGGRNVRTLCFQEDVSCGQVCARPLENCTHACQKSCHQSGNCQTKCKQVCNQKRIYCDHKCRKPCHGNEDCPDIPCTISIAIKCACGVRETFVTCGAFSKAPSSSETTKIPCTEECEKHKRHLQLKEAFGISSEPNVESNSTATSLEKLAATATSFDELQLPFTEPALVIYSKQVTWCAQIENVLNSLIDNEEKTSLHFKPMRPPQRHFVHELAKAYKFYAESQDAEPKRSVFIKKTALSCKPLISLEESLPFYQLFKQYEKEKKTQRLESQTTTKLINFTLKEEVKVDLATNNAFLIRNIARGTTTEDLERAFAEHLKPTLIKNPQYKILDLEKKALIFPESYATTTVNVERDIAALVGHFDYICKDLFIGDGVELSFVDQEGLGEVSHIPEQE